MHVPSFSFKGMCRLKEEQEFKEFAANAGALDNIFSRMAPQIFGHENIKKALACLLFGGARKVSNASERILCADCLYHTRPAAFATSFP